MILHRCCYGSQSDKSGIRDVDALAGYGYVGLFIASFLAATVLPLSSELVLAVVLLNRHDPLIAVAVATTGNVSGSALNYALGFWGSAPFMQKVLRLSPAKMARSEQRFKKYGVISLLFAWLPIIGDPITVIAGVFKVNVYLFLTLVTIGKLLRYIVISVPVLSL